MNINAIMINGYKTQEVTYYAGRVVKGSKEVCDFYLDTDGMYYTTNVVDKKTFDEVFEGSHVLFDSKIKTLVNEELASRAEKARGGKPYLKLVG